MKEMKETSGALPAAKNPFGLKLSFREQDDTYISEFTGQPQHQGYDGIMHGGIVSTLLDEIMARYLYAKGMNAVTGRLEVRYNKPTPIGVPLLIVGDGKALTMIDYEVRQVQRWPIGNSPLGALLDPSKDLSKFGKVVPTGDPSILSVEARDPKRPEFGTMLF